MSTKPERWKWWSGRWSERDACGAWATVDDVESGRADELCRNGGSRWGPFSRFVRDQNPRIREEYAAAMEAAAHEAEKATNGYMTRKGAPRQYGLRDWYPPSGKRPPSEKWASDELLDFWAAGGPRPMTLAEYRRGYQEQFAPPTDWD